MTGSIGVRHLQLFGAATCLLTGAFVMAESRIPRPPRAAVRPVRDTYFSATVTDPYRWLEDTKSPAVISWLGEQTQYSRAYFDRIPERQSLVERIRALSEEQTAVQLVDLWNNRFFYLNTPRGADTARIYYRDGADGGEKQLFDPASLDSPGKRHAIDSLYPSRDGRYVAIGTSANGAREQSAISIIDSATGQILAERLERAPVPSISWSQDNHSFFYMQLAKPKPGDDPSQYNQRGRVLLHQLNTDPSQDLPIFGYGLSPLVQLNEDDFPAVYVPSGSKYVFASAENGVQDELSLYVTQRDQVKGATTPWRKLFGSDQGITRFGVRGDDLFILSHKGASRFQVLRTSVSHCDLAHATVVQAAGEAVITDLRVAKDALYLVELDGGVGRVRRIPFSGEPASFVKMPFAGTVHQLFGEESTAGIIFLMESWTHPRTLLAYDPVKGLFDTKIAAPPSVDFSAVEAIEVRAKGADGVSIPLSIIYKRGTKLDGTNPTILLAYGAYGVSFNPSFDARRLAWLERGGIQAIAHIRGGGEYGEDWHRDGMKAKRQNKINDVVSCARYLIDHKYTNPASLAIEGTSAGATTMATVVVQQPSLFAAAVLNVGVYDMLRAELMLLGPANVIEFGSVKTPEGFEELFRTSPYHHVKDGTRYPAILLTTGLNDPTVAPWQTAKMAARLQAATANNRPILLRADSDVGHGAGSSKSKRIAGLADELAFLRTELGSTRLSD